MRKGKLVLIGLVLMLFVFLFFLVDSLSAPNDPGVVITNERTGEFYDVCHCLEDYFDCTPPPLDPLIVHCFDVCQRSVIDDPSRLDLNFDDIPCN